MSKPEPKKLTRSEDAKQLGIDLHLYMEIANSLMENILLVANPETNEKAYIHLKDQRLSQLKDFRNLLLEQYQQHQIDGSTLLSEIQRRINRFIKAKKDKYGI